MSLYFNKAEAIKSGNVNALNKQWHIMNSLRNPTDKQVADFIAANKQLGGQLLTPQGNAVKTPADAYRAFDPTTKIENSTLGEFATLNKLMPLSKSVMLGKSVYEFRKSSRAGSAVTSLSPNVGIPTDKVDYKYQKTVIPFHQVKYGIDWQEAMQGRSEGFDTLIDGSREAEHNVYSKMQDYLWNGNDKLVVDGSFWGGIKGDASVAQETLGVDLSSAAVAAIDKFNEVKRVRDVLRIDNKCTGGLKLAVSNEIMSDWETPVNTGDSSHRTVLQLISSLRGIEEIYEDSELEGNEIALFKMGQDSFHPVTSMALGSFALNRVQQFDDFEFLKVAGVGFMAKTSFDGNTCALYAS